jgi:hypothetical protein
METNSQCEPLPVPPAHGEPKKLSPFAKAIIREINSFEKELGIAIPRGIYESVPMCKFGYYFSSKDGFLGTHTNSEFINLLKEKSNGHLVAFGQTRYDFCRGCFELYYANSALGYRLNILFGGAFRDNDAIAEEIAKIRAKLPSLIAKYKPFGDGGITVIFDKGKAGKRLRDSTFKVMADRGKCHETEWLGSHRQR